MSSLDGVTAGATATLRFSVSDGDTARALGSGDVDVLATPRLLAWAEAATCAVLEGRLGDQRTSVGTRVQLDHLLATGVGGTVRVTATLQHVDGRLLRFEVTAQDGHERLVGSGEVRRVVVDRERFAARVPGA